MKPECDISIVPQSSESMPGLLLRNSIDSQRAQEVHRSPSEFGICPRELSSDILESTYSTACTGIETDMVASFHTAQDPLDAASGAVMTAQGHTSGRERLYANTPYVSLENSSTVSPPSWEMGENSTVSSGETITLGQVHIQRGIPSFSHDDAGIHLEAGNGVRRQFFRDSANSLSEDFQIPNLNREHMQENLPVEPRDNCILSRFRAIRNARNSYNCSGTQHLGSSGHVSGACEIPASRKESEQMYASGDQLLGVSLDGAENHGNLSMSSSRGSSKRKICAVGNSASGSSSKVSAYTSSSDPVLLGAVGNSSRFSNGPMFSCVNSAFGESSESMVTSVEGSNVHHAEAQLQQERSSMDVSNVYIDGSYRGMLLGSNSGENARTFPAENSGIGTSSYAPGQTVSNLNPSQVRRRAGQAQPDLRLSRRMQYDPSTSSLQMNADFNTILPSSSPFSDGHGRVSSANFSSRRESFSARQTDSYFDSDASGDRFRQNAINALRSGRIRFPSSSAYEVVSPEAMNQVNSMHSDAFELFNPTYPSIHALPSTEGSSGHGFSEYGSTRSRSHLPSSQHRHLTGLTSSTSFPPSILSSSTLEPSANSGNSGLPTASERPPSSSRVLRRLMLSRQSLLDVFGERLPFSVAGNLIGLPLQRLGAVRISEDQHHRVINEEINEQLLMLEATILFGGIGLQDQHSDWRLDVDNMSYEELLALGERIGDVCTGLSEEAIFQKLKMSKFIVYAQRATSVLQETEMKCCICQEEYEEGNELGGLTCGHNYHTACIKQWLTLKNSCPVCKATALS